MQGCRVNARALAQRIPPPQQSEYLQPFWAQALFSPTYADAILDRIIHNAQLRSLQAAFLITYSISRSAPAAPRCWRDCGP
jgi:hypothetical protein